MINPLAQRQLYQTANVEAVRQAHEVSGALQREQGLQKAADERLAEASSAALAIVLVGLLPLILLSRQIARSRKG